MCQLIIDNIREARVTFREHERRHFVYDEVVQDINRAIQYNNVNDVSNSIIRLLDEWTPIHHINPMNYEDLPTKIEENWEQILRFRLRSIIDFCDGDEVEIRRIFGLLVDLTGKVGTAKSLHLLAPNFFPLWDNPIAQAYGLKLGKSSMIPRKYISFMRATQVQFRNLAHHFPEGYDLLKAIDEYNYCRYTKHWIKNNDPLSFLKHQVEIIGIL